MRFAFVDEGGISQHEPHAVVAAVFVHGDEQVIPLENKLQELVRKHIPEKDWEGFVFHAKDIWSGKDISAIGMNGRGSAARRSWTTWSISQRN